MRQEMVPKLVQGGHRGPPADDAAVAAATAMRCAWPPPAADATWKNTRPTGFSGVPPPGPATPVTGHGHVRPQPLDGAVGHRLGHLGADRAVALEQLVRHAQQPPLELVRVA